MANQPKPSQFTDSDLKACKNWIHFVWKDINYVDKEHTGSSKMTNERQEGKRQTDKQKEKKKKKVGKK